MITDDTAAAAILGQKTTPIPNDHPNPKLTTAADLKYIEAALTMIHTVYQTRVRYVETDRMDVVHHSNYLVWFEAARIQMLDEIGLPYKQMEEDGFLIPSPRCRALLQTPSDVR